MAGSYWNVVVPAWLPGVVGSGSFRVIVETEPGGGLSSEATVKLHANGVRIISTAEGNGPVNALDAALRKAIGRHYPALAMLHLTDYKVRVLDTSKGTAAVTRVLIDSTDGDRTWSTIGVSVSQRSPRLRVRSWPRVQLSCANPPR